MRTNVDESRPNSYLSKRSLADALQGLHTLGAMSSTNTNVCILLEFHLAYVLDFWILKYTNFNLIAEHTYEDLTKGV